MDGQIEARWAPLIGITFDHKDDRLLASVNRELTKSSRWPLPFPTEVCGRKP